MAEDNEDIRAMNAQGTAYLSGYLGIEMTSSSGRELCSQMAIQPHHLAPNGYLHAASIVALADTTCGFAALANLPSGALSFTTIELKSNHLGTAREGTIACVARAQHLGKSTQVWDATVTETSSGATIALFRCTQMVIWPRS